MGVSRKHRGVGVAEAIPGAKLTDLVCRCMRKLFTLHRKLLKDDQEYQGRKRDPLHCGILRELLIVNQKQNQKWAEERDIQQVRMWVVYSVYGHACTTGASQQWRRISSGKPVRVDAMTTLGLV